MDNKNKLILLILSLAFVLGYQACGPAMHSHRNLENSQMNNPSNTEFFKCSPQEPNKSSQLMRLSRVEYLNTLSDLAKKLSNTEKSVLQQKINNKSSLLPKDSLGQYEKMDHRVSLNHVSSYYDLAYEFANHVSQSQNVNSFYPSCVAKGNANENCIKSFIQDFGLKVYRRPLSDVEVDTLYNFYVNRGTTGLVDLVARLLTSPQFLYHLENQGEFVGGSGNKIKLTGYEVAARLSYLYLQSMPTDELFTAAANGELSSLTGVKKQIELLFANEKSRIQTTIRDYVSQWLEFQYKPGFTQTAKLQALGKTLGMTAPIDNNLRSEMLDELLDMVEYYTWDKENGNFSDLMTSPYSFAKGETLAKIYGVSQWSTGEEPPRLPASERSGIFTRAGNLYTGSEKTSPIKYGVSVIRKVLCDSIPNPSQSIIDDTIRTPNIDHDDKTQREIVSEMTSSNRCSSCHSIINPLGFAAESYDAFGGFRHQKLEYKFDDGGALINSLPVDTSAEIILDGHSYPVNNAVEMNAQINNSGKAHACFVRNFFRFSHRRIENQQKDGCTMASMYNELKNPEGGLKKMFQSMGTDESFLYKEID